MRLGRPGVSRLAGPQIITARIGAPDIAAIVRTGFFHGGVPDIDEPAGLKTHRIRCSNLDGQSEE